MKVINKPRRSGKTTQLIYTSATMDIPIIVSTESRKKYLLARAEDLAVKIPTPMTVSQCKSSIGAFLSPKSVLIDESLDIIEAALSEYLNGANIAAITMTTPELEAAQRKQIENTSATKSNDE